MDKFGFSISEGRQIDYDSNNRSLAAFIFEKCGGCSATCTSANFTGFSLREVHILIKRGENDQVQKSLNKCMLCGKCTLVCPRGVNTRNIIVLAKKAFQNSDEYAI